MSTVVGFAIVFNSPSVPLPGPFVEIIRPSAVDRTLASRADVLALLDHDTGKIVGRTVANTLRLEKRARGLHVEIDPPNTTYAIDMLESISRSDLRGMSFAFRSAEDEWVMQGDMPVRYVLAMDLLEVSIVAAPAYSETSVSLQRSSVSSSRSAPDDAAVEARAATVRRLMLAETLEQRERLTIVREIHSERGRRPGLVVAFDAAGGLEIRDAKGSVHERQKWLDHDQDRHEPLAIGAAPVPRQFVPYTPRPALPARPAVSVRTHWWAPWATEETRWP